MARNKTASKTAKQPNRVTITREDDPGLYARLDKLIGIYFPTTLEFCRISLEWRHNVTPDADGKIKRTWTKLCPDEHRARHNFDVIIGLNFPIWQEAAPDLRDYMMDCALEAIVQAMANDEVKCDPAGKELFKLKRHDIECFSAVEIRHPGCCLEVVRLVRRIAPLLPPPERTLMDEMEKKPKQTKAEARRDAIPVHRGWQLAGPAKVGKALVEEVARAEIDRFFELVDAGNRSAATMIQRKLEAGGWAPPAHEAPAAARELAMAIADGRTASAGAS